MLAWMIPGNKGCLHFWLDSAHASFHWRNERKHTAQLEEAEVSAQVLLSICSDFQV